MASVAVLLGCGSVGEEVALVVPGKIAPGVPQAVSKMMRRKEAITLETDNFGDFLKEIDFIINPPELDWFDFRCSLNKLYSYSRRNPICPIWLMLVEPD